MYNQKYSFTMNTFQQIALWLHTSFAYKLLGKTHKRIIAWRAIHIACDVGNRVHTRHDSDEDVRGNACKQTIALWFYLGLSRLYSSFLPLLHLAR